MIGKSYDFRHSPNNNKENQNYLKLLLRNLLKKIILSMDVMKSLFFSEFNNVGIVIPIFNLKDRYVMSYLVELCLD